LSRFGRDSKGDARSIVVAIEGDEGYASMLMSVSIIILHGEGPCAEVGTVFITSAFPRNPRGEEPGTRTWWILSLPAVACANTMQKHDAYPADDMMYVPRTKD